MYRVLYDEPKVFRNEVHLFLLRNVHDEVKLDKRVDWSTVKGVLDKVKIPALANRLILMGVLRYPASGMGRTKPKVAPANTYLTQTSSEDFDSDGSQYPTSHTF